jgi:hypothetical protein
MLRHDLELQLTTGEVKHAGDPLSADPAALGRLARPALVAVGELDMPDFFRGGEDMDVHWSRPL